MNRSHPSQHRPYWQQIIASALGISLVFTSSPSPASDPEQARIDNILGNTSELIIRRSGRRESVQIGSVLQQIRDALITAPPNNAYALLRFLSGSGEDLNFYIQTNPHAEAAIYYFPCQMQGGDYQNERRKARCLSGKCAGLSDPIGQDPRGQHPCLGSGRARYRGGIAQSASPGRCFPLCFHRVVHVACVKGFTALLKIKRKRFEADAAAAWDIKTADFLAQSFSRHVEALGVAQPDLVALSRHARKTGQSFRITQGNQLQRLAVTMMALGAHMLDDPRFWLSAHKTLSEYHADQTLRLDRVAGISQAWARALWENDTLTAMGARLTQRLRAVNTIPFWSYEDVLPQHIDLLTPEIEHRFQRHVHERIQMIGFRDQERALAYYLLTLAHGVHWWQDPLYARLRHIFETTQSPDAFVSGIDHFYQGFSK